MIVSTWGDGDDGQGYQRDTFRLKALGSSHRVHGILCEKEKGKVRLC